MTVETLSERLFQQHCASRNVSCVRIEEGVCKAPDFEVVLDSPVVVEVKQFDPNPIDLAREALPSGTVMSSMGGPAKRVRNQLGSAYRQIRPYTRQGIPGIVVLYNNAGGINYIDNFSVTRAMFGGMAVHIRRGNDGVIHHAGQGFTGDRRVTRNTCRGLSAVCVLSKCGREGTALVLYHNPYAIHPINTRSLLGFADRQFAYNDPHGGLFGNLLAHELEV